MYLGDYMDMKLRGIEKLAQMFGDQPTFTVGDVMHRVSADMTLDPFRQRRINSAIVGTGLPVSAPGGRLVHMGIGALAGNAIGKYLGANPFWKGVTTLGGALYGNSLYNAAHRDPSLPPGVSRAF